MRAFGGSGPSTNSAGICVTSILGQGFYCLIFTAAGAAGTIYTEIGSAGNVYRKLTIDNNNLATTRGVASEMSDMAATGTAVSYYLDELRIVRLGQFALLQSDSYPVIRTVLSVQNYTGDASGSLLVLAYTQINLLTAGGSATLISSQNVSTVYPAAYREADTTTVAMASGPAVINAFSVYVYASGQLVLPPKVNVAGVTMQVDGNLYGVSDLKISGGGLVSIRWDASSTATNPQAPVSNMFQLSSVYVQDSSTLALVHNKVENSMLVFIASSSMIFADSSTLSITGAVQLQTPSLWVNNSAVINGIGNGYAPSTTNTLCPQSGSGQTGYYFILFYFIIFFFAVLLTFI